MTPPLQRVVDLREAGIRLAIPRTSDDGRPIDLDDVRIHIASRGGDGLYLEVTRQLGIEPGAAYERERSFVTDRLGATPTDLVDATFAGHPARSWSFAWDGRRRVVHLVVIGEWLYRVIHDPAAPLAPAILATIELG